MWEFIVSQLQRWGVQGQGVGGARSTEGSGGVPAPSFLLVSSHLQVIFGV